MSMDYSEFEGISPYSDEEAVEALKQVARHPYTYVISKSMFPNEKLNYLSTILSNLKSVDDFQKTVMVKAVEWDLQNTFTSFTYDGVEFLKDLPNKYLLMSNHRDIILDPALTQYVLNENGIPMSEICVGSNLLSSKTVERLLRSNRMIKVIRGISARELYLSSQLLSKYIRTAITSGTSSVWIAQRQGRTKNGIDTTEQGLVKMLDMSGSKSFMDNFKEICIVPLAISYEYEPCDARKACELLISKTQTYVKKRNEDLHSIITGIRQQKGQAHLHIGHPLTEAELRIASECAKNDRYQAIRHIVDKRIIASYKLWKTNYMGYDLMTKSDKYADKYNPEDLEAFKKYTEHKLGKCSRSLNYEDLRQIFWEIYGNPVLAREELVAGLFR